MAPSRADPPQPRVWLVLGDKRGDNAQAEALAGALPWPSERKEIALHEPWVLGKPRVEPSLHHVDLSRSDPFEPPWPDLVITIGRRPSMVALWIQEQSGGCTRTVLLGKPSGMMERFDLVIVSSEAQLPPLPSVFHVKLPLLRVDEGDVAAAVEAWRPRLGALPRPLVAFLVGGPTGPFVFDVAASHRLVQLAEEIAAQGGTPFVTTSRRTPAEVVAALETRLPEQAHLFRWEPGAAENPYRALLGLADGFVVSSDSISMIVEVARLRRPLAIFTLPTGRLGALDQIRRSVTRKLFSHEGEGAGARLRRALARWLFRLGMVNHTRDFRALHELLIQRGLAVWAGEPFRSPEGPVPDDLQRAADRVCKLVGEGKPVSPT